MISMVFMAGLTWLPFRVILSLGLAIVLGHFYLLHTLRMIVFFAAGHTMTEADKSLQIIPMLFVLLGDGGYSLGVVYLIWIAVVASLYPLCRWYDAYKTTHHEQWWLSYL